MNILIDKAVEKMQLGEDLFDVIYNINRMMYGLDNTHVTPEEEIIEAIYENSEHMIYDLEHSRQHVAMYVVSALRRGQA